MKANVKVMRSVLLALALVGAAPAMATSTVVSHGRFDQVTVLQPDTPVQRVVVWFERGAGHSAPAQALRADGALVARVDIGAVAAALRREHAGSCAFGAGDLENFSRWLQARLQLDGYRLPLVGGEAEGAAVAYALSAQAAPGTVAGLLTTRFSTTATLPDWLCGPAHAQGVLQPVAVPVPWLNAGHPAEAGTWLAAAGQGRGFALANGSDPAPGLVAAARVLGAQRGIALAAPPAALQGLPVVEVPAAVPGRQLAVFFSGDGGWAGLDKDVAAALARRGVAVVGVDSLRYFWKARTPQGVAADIERIVAHYRQQWQRDQIMLVGFSQGADVLPASINALDPALRGQLQRIALLSVGRKAEFEFHVTNWLGSSGAGVPIAPQIARLPAGKVLCIYGATDADALCPDLPGADHVQVLRLPGDHHFGGDYQRVAGLILDTP